MSIEIKKVIRAAEIGREYFFYGYKNELICNIVFFIVFWLLEGNREYDKRISYSSTLAMYWLILYTLGCLIFNLVHGIKKYNKQEKIADIVDFLPMNKESRNLSNFLINYRKSINVFIPCICMYLYGGNNEYLRGILILDMAVMIISESIRNIFMNNGVMRNKRRAIFICDVIPVIVVIGTIILMLFRSGIDFFEVMGNFFIGIVLGIVSFMFMIYTAVKYKEVI